MPLALAGFGTNGLPLRPLETRNVPGSPLAPGVLGPYVIFWNFPPASLQNKAKTKGISQTAMYKAIRTSFQLRRAVPSSHGVSVWPRRFSSPSSTSQPAGSIQSSNVLDVEVQNEYRLGGFHPVELGDVLGARYRVVRKLGYGQYSTVWLVEDNGYIHVLKRHLIAGQASIWPSRFYKARQPQATKEATSLSFLFARRLQIQTILDTSISSFCWTTSSTRDQTETIYVW